MGAFTASSSAVCPVVNYINYSFLFIKYALQIWLWFKGL